MVWLDPINGIAGNIQVLEMLSKNMRIEVKLAWWSLLHYFAEICFGFIQLISSNLLEKIFVNQLQLSPCARIIFIIECL